MKSCKIRNVFFIFLLSFGCSNNSKSSVDIDTMDTDSAIDSESDTSLDSQTESDAATDTWSDAETDTNVFVASPKRQVMTWVPTYGIAGAKATLQKSYGSTAVVDCITRIGLQLWTVRKEGSVELEDGVTEDDVKWFADFGDKNGIKILLTLINNGEKDYDNPGFDWRVTRAACYGDTGDITIENTLLEVKKYNLEGVDLDLEGYGTNGAPFTGDDRLQYGIFVNKIADALHKESKLLTVDSFHSTDGGIPSPSWWNDWLSHVDTIHSMGYYNIYKDGPGYGSYRSQQKLAADAGFKPGQVLSGVPMWVDNWAGAQDNTGISNVDNLSQVLNCLDPGLGVSLWAIHHPEAWTIPETGTKPWQDEAPWAILSDIVNETPQDKSACEAPPAENGVIDDMTYSGICLLGGSWLAISDYWSRTADDRDNSSIVWNSDKSYDLALGEGSWGDITKGYETLTTGGKSLEAVIETTAPIGSSDSFGYLQLYFLPKDCSQAPDVCYDLYQNGVETDFSAYSKMVVGLKCDAGKTVWLGLSSKSSGSSRSNHRGVHVNCTGDFEDYELVFADLKAPDGSGTAGFDASKSLLLQIVWEDNTAPGTNKLTVAGVALDQSVLSLRGIN
ncbi:MAG: hypothetical protein JXR91_11440 [Deltaproteobacteria bacterium]|nr:hypothetical protein [Deltaproteobacteria bacterium]